MDRVVGVGLRVGGRLSGVAVFASALFLARLVLMAGLPIGASVGCSSGGGCDSSKCAPGNTCIDDGSGGGASCHKLCATQAGCPFNYYCNDAPAGSGMAGSWCAKQSTIYPVRPGGQWGAQCLPTGGEANNPACDTGDGFACYGATPTVATAFCTVFGCKQDTDCPGGWWCATVNEAPNVTTTKPAYGVVRTVCKPRDYCAPCQKDHDCAPSPDGTPHCVQDTNMRGYCTHACAGSSSCALDATCAPQWGLCTLGAGAACKTDDDCPMANGVLQHCDAGKCTPECGSTSDCGSGQKCVVVRACVPRAGVCVGDGSFCSPCRSDADCASGGGNCLSGQPYSTERFCSVQSTVSPCNATRANPPGCPTRTKSDNWLATGCATAPPDQCEGLVTFGTAAGSRTALPGCWTVNR